MNIDSQSTPKDVARFGEFIQTRKAGPYSYVVLLGLNVFDLAAIMRLIQKGLPWKAFERLVRNMGMQTEQVATMIDVPKRTLARRKNEGRFQPDESDRLLRAARVFSSALRLYGGKRDAAAEWLLHPNTALGGATPLEFAQTGIGAQEVEHLVMRIQHGVYS